MTRRRQYTMVVAEIIRSFEAWHEEFASVTRRAPTRFENQDWRGARTDARERLGLYSRFVSEAVERIGNGVTDAGFVAAKAEYSAWLADRPDWEVGETFFNSVIRRLHPGSGVDPASHFVATAYGRPPQQPRRDPFHSYDDFGDTTTLIKEILTDYRFGALYRDLNEDARLAAAAIDERVDGPIRLAEIIRPVFFRARGAYLVGRLHTTNSRYPLVLCLRNNGGVEVDAVLLDEDDVSILFSFTRSYFQVETVRPYELVRFLAQLMPRKRLSELYATIGYNKHAKTELHRELEDFLGGTTALFEEAPGTRGLVMVVFTMPGLDLVFKVLRDRFGPPKTVTHRHVRDRYSFVFTHDRAGRLIDAREFLGLTLPVERFGPELLARLLADCAGRVSLDGTTVDLAHAYVERRVSPLDLYVRERPSEEARRAVVDYGTAIKDMAVTDVFPGDLLLKNFGVTRHSRVVFYDYDELTNVTACRFRALPPDYAETGQAAFGVAENDIFPEELRSFLGLPETLKEVFLRHHDDLLHPEYWNQIKGRLEEGEVIDITPYRQEVRLRPG